jgi:hypothetical protein
MSENVGFKTGPIFCLTRINGEAVSLHGSAFGGSLEVIDLLPTLAGNILLEFIVDEDSIVSIGTEDFLQLVELSKTLGSDEPAILEMLASSLTVGVDTKSENAFSFLSTLKWADKLRYFRYDQNWNVDKEAILDGVEEVRVSTLSEF